MPIFRIGYEFNKLLEPVLQVYLNDDEANRYAEEWEPIEAETLPAAYAAYRVLCEGPDESDEGSWGLPMEEGDEL